MMQTATCPFLSLGRLRVSAVLFALIGIVRVAHAVEIDGKVIEITADVVKVAVDGASFPISGDATTIFFKLPGGNDEVLVGTGKVFDVANDIVTVKFEDVKGTVQTGQLVRIVSDKPARRSVSLTPPGQPAPIPQPAATGAATNESTTVVLNFSAIGTEAVRPDLFTSHGITSVTASGGDLVVEPAESSMVLPAGHKFVLKVTDPDHHNADTTITLEFAKPVHKFSITRVGLTSGSLPTLRMEAIGENGRRMEAFNDGYGTAAEARITEWKTFSVGGEGSSPIAKVRIMASDVKGDNYPVFNSLPLAEISFEPVASDTSKAPPKATDSAGSSEPADANLYASRQADDPVFNFGPNDFKIDFRCKFNGFAHEQVLMEKFTGATGPGWTLTLINQQTLVFYGQGAGAFKASVKLKPQRSYHLTVLRDRSRLSMLVDGAVVLARPIHGSISASSNPLLVGRRNQEDGRPFPLEGAITDIRIETGIAAQSREAKPPPASVATAGEGDLRSRLLGKWQGGRHVTQNFADGTYILDPDIVPQPIRQSISRWRVEGNRLIVSDAAGIRTDTIVSLTARELVIKDEQGRTYHDKRISP